MIKQVGQGSFGVVRKVKSLIDSKIYAIKSISMGEKKMEQKQMQEVDILKELKHPNIIEYCGYFTGLDFGKKNESKVRQMPSSYSVLVQRKSVDPDNGSHQEIQKSGSQISLRVESPDANQKLLKSEVSFFSWPG